MPVEFDRSNWVVELGGNPLRLHCMPAWLNLNDLHPVFEGDRIQPVKLGGNPLRLHCMPVKGFRCQSNLTGQIGWESIEITLYACYRL